MEEIIFEKLSQVISTVNKNQEKVFIDYLNGTNLSLIEQRKQLTLLQIKKLEIEILNLKKDIQIIENNVTFIENFHSIESLFLEVLSTEPVSIDYLRYQIGVREKRINRLNQEQVEQDERDALEGK